MLRKIADYIIPINVIFDIATVFFQEGKILAYARLALMLLLILTSIRSRDIRHYRWILLFCVYVLIIDFCSTDILESLNISLKVLISISAFIIGFHYFNDFKWLLRLNKSIVVTFGLLILNFIMSSVFHIGESLYAEDDGFLVGNLRDNWNVYTYSLMLVPLILVFREKRKRAFVLAMAFFNAVVLVLSMKRIAITGLAMGLLINKIFTFKAVRDLKTGIVIIILVLGTFPLYENLLLSRFEARSNRFEEGALEQEGRFLETAYVWEDVLSFDRPLVSLFGLEGFNSVGNYANGMFGERNLHVDYNLMANTIGLVGLFLYLMIFIGIFKLHREVKRAYETIPAEYAKQMKATFFALFFTPFVTSLGGQMYGVTFRTIIFIYMGAILGILYRRMGYPSTSAKP